MKCNRRFPEGICDTEMNEGVGFSKEKAYVCTRCGNELHDRGDGVLLDRREWNQHLSEFQ